jgi:hypothetical protein
MHMQDYLLALMLASLVALIVVIGRAVFRKLFKKATIEKEPEDPEQVTSAPSLKPFSNPITLSMLMLCVSLIVIGVFYALVIVSPWGIVVGSIGVLLWWAGYTKHSTDPREAGALTFWGSYLQIGGRAVIVGGETILAPYWPIKLESVKFPITNYDHDFKIRIYVGKDPKKKLPLEGTVSVTFRPCVEDAVDYITAGKIEKIIPQVDDIVLVETRELAASLEPEDIVYTPKKLQVLFGKGGLQGILEDVFERKAFGLEILKVQPDFDFTEDIRKKMSEVKKEEFDRVVELTEYRTDVKGALVILRAHRMTGDRKYTFNQALQEAKQLRLIRDEKVVRVDTSGGSVVLADAKFNLGK